MEAMIRVQSWLSDEGIEMMRQIAAFIVMAMPATAHATPIYLTCDFAEKPGYGIKLTADEGAGTVAVIVPSTGYSETMRAAFSTDRVVFEGRLLSYSLSRVSLKLERTIKSINAIDHGICRIEAAPKRAF
ncbi:MAG: hypothetical protein U5M50_16470 [Sphingobium sp.]|nr:hypothetical protein [Sphingobium sp.]